MPSPSLSPGASSGSPGWRAGRGVERALVVAVQHAVLVVVGLGAAVRVLEAVAVLGAVRAGVVLVGDAVAVGVLLLDLHHHLLRGGLTGVISTLLAAVLGGRGRLSGLSLTTTFWGAQFLESSSAALMAVSAVRMCSEAR